MKKRAGSRAVARGARPEPSKARCRAPSGPKRVASGILKLRATLLKFAGSVKGMPRDLARNHDHYLYGTPKK